MGKQSSYGKATKKKTSPVAPTFFEKSDSLEGFEDISTQTMAIPFIRVLQTLSPQLNKKKPEYVEEAQEGMFFNTVTKKVYGTSKIVRRVLGLVSAQNGRFFLTCDRFWCIIIVFT